MLTVKQVCARVGLSRPCVYRMARAGTFPPGYKLTPGDKGAVRWDAAEVEAWLSSRPLSIAPIAEPDRAVA